MRSGQEFAVTLLKLRRVNGVAADDDLRLKFDPSQARAVLLLASASPRRRDLLRTAGIDFRVEISRAEELAGEGWRARELCLLNSERKALEVALRFPDCVVLGADTLVSLEGQVFGKPADFQEARDMLERLCGRVHEVLTGVCIVQRSERKLCRFVESTRVKFRSQQTVDLEHYLRSIHPLDKAGGYAAQEDHGRLIECIEGSMSNVIGLPIERVLTALNRHFSNRTGESKQCQSPAADSERWAN